jgi:predicted DNA-binding transcriptional regulator AlpA
MGESPAGRRGQRGIDLMKSEPPMPPNLPPRGIRRECAARYVGISPSKFDEMVGDGRMPKPKMIDAARVWDVRALDIAFDRLPDVAGGDAPNEWDVVLS